MRILKTLLLLLTLASSGCAGERLTVNAGRLEIKDIQGTAHQLPGTSARATVFFFITSDCPISNRYAPEINRISADYAAKNIDFYLVHSDPDLTASAARQHAKEFGYRCPVLLDRAHALAKKTGATVTPEVAVLSPGGELLYRGRIDDWYANYGKFRREPTKRDLRLALDAILEGQPVSNPRTKSIGCFIPLD